MEFQETTTYQQYEIWNNARRAKILITVFWVLIVFNLVAFVSGYFELTLLEEIKNGGFIEEEDATLNDLRQMIVGLIQTGLAITSIIVFLNWFRRAYGNLHRVGTYTPNYEESMAVWSWVIPIIVFFRPVQIMNEIWSETQTRIIALNKNYVSKSGGVVIGIWWFLFILSNFVGKYLLKTAFKDETLDELISSAQVTMISDMMQIIEALLVIFIVTQISNMEAKLSEEVSLAGGKVIHL